MAAGLTIGALLAAGFGAKMIKDLIEGGWERGLKREEMTQRGDIEKSKQTAMARLLRESKTSERRDIKRLTRERTTERREGREADLLKYFMQNRQNQMAMVLQAMQGVNQPSLGQSVGGGSGSGFLNVARSNF